LTRDIQIGVGRVGEHGYLVVDTGGVDDSGDEVSVMVSQHALRTAAECACILMMVDGRAGLNADDEELAQHLRQLGKPVFLVANKTENQDSDIVAAEFAKLGLGPLFAISAAHGHGIEPLIEAVSEGWPTAADRQGDETSHTVRVALIGRPNVGKSTLLNRIIGDERMITSERPGTTRDSIEVPFERRGRPYILIDTAGLRRRGRVTDLVEKFSAIKSLQAVDLANVVVLVLDAHEAITEQDATLLGLVIESGRSLVIAVNKWDGLEPGARGQIREQVDRKLRFVDFAEIRYISALHRIGVGHLFDAVDKAWKSAHAAPPTHMLTGLLKRAIETHQPPLARGRRIKLRYAHLGGKNPPTIVIHGNQTGSVPDSYRRYLSGYFRKALKLTCTPVKIEFKTGDNPFEGRRNVLNKRQVQKRRRLMKYVKRKR
jgi:GTP-binding protein